MPPTGRAAARQSVASSFLASLVPRSSRRPSPGTPAYLTHGARLGPKGETWRQCRQRKCRPTRTMATLSDYYLHLSGCRPQPILGRVPLLGVRWVWRVVVRG